MYKHLLVTLDGSETSEAVLPEVARLAEGQDVRVTLLTVAEDAQGTRDEPEPTRASGLFAPGVVAKGSEARVREDRGQALERTKDELTTYLGRKARELKDAGMDVDTAVAFGDPVKEILSAADAHRADLIVMATHGRAGLAQVMFGSVATRVVGSGARPVLLVRPGNLR